MGILERIADIEKEIARTQKNKATEYHLGTLKARLAKLRSQLIDTRLAAGSGNTGDGFDVAKSGDARVVLIGFPSVGKSTLMSKLTSTASAIAAYEFTTLTCVPGRLYLEGSRIQLLDLPGIIEGAAQGRGRGKQVIAVAKTADLILVMLDATKAPLSPALLNTVATNGVNHGSSASSTSTSPTSSPRLVVHKWRSLLFHRLLLPG